MVWGHSAGPAPVLRRKPKPPGAVDGLRVAAAASPFASSAAAPSPFAATAGPSSASAFAGLLAPAQSSPATATLLGLAGALWFLVLQCAPLSPIA